MPRPRKFRAWAWSPIIVLRISLVITYIMFVGFATIAFISGIPAFTITDMDAYTPYWAVALGVSSVVAAIGSVTDRWQKVEKWASMLVSTLYAGYVGTIALIAFGGGYTDKQALGAAVGIGLVLPLARFIYLAAQTGKIKIVHL